MNTAPTPTGFRKKVGTQKFLTGPAGLLSLLLAMSQASEAAPDTQASWTGAGANPNWSTVGNWDATPPNLAPPANPMTQATPGNGSGKVDFPGTGTVGLTTVDVPWTVGVISMAGGKNITFSGADLTIQQSTSQSTLTLSVGAIQIGNATTTRTVNFTNNIIFDNAVSLAAPTELAHVIIQRTGNLNGSINFFGGVSAVGTNDSVEVRANSPVFFYGGVYLNTNATDYNLGVAMLNNSAASAVHFYKTNNTMNGISLNRGTIHIHDHNTFPAHVRITAGGSVTRPYAMALNDFDQTFKYIEETPGQNGVRDLSTGTGVGGTLTLNDNAVTNEWSGWVLSGPGRLVKNGNGTLMLDRTQTHTGGTTVNGGILQLGNGGSGGLLDPSGNITNNATLIFNTPDSTSIGGVLAGNGNIQKLNSSLIGFTGATPYSGNISIAAGSLQVSGAGNFSPATAISVANGATLDVSLSPGLTRSAGQSLSGGGTVVGAVSAQPGSSMTIGSSPGTLTVNGNSTLNGTTLNMELSGDPTTIGSGVNDLLDVTGTLTLTNVSTIYVNPLAALSTATPYKVIHYGALSGFSSNLVATLPYAGRYGFTVQDNPPYLELAVSATLNGALMWRGGNPGNPIRWDIATTTNWLNGATPDKFLANDPVAFDDSALTNQVTLVGALVSPSLMASNNSLNYALDGAGSLTLATLGMQGNGQFTIANTAANTLGAVSVNAGSLKVANTGANTLGAVSVSAGALSIANTGTDTLASLAVNGGAVTISNSAPASLGDVGLTNGTVTIANNGPNTFASIAVAGGTMEFNQSTNVTVATAIVGGGSLVKSGANTLTFAANNSAFTGNLQINSGVLRAGANNAIGANNNATVANGATLDMNGFSLGNTTLTLQGAGVGGRGAIDNGGGNSFAAFAGVVLAGDTTFGASAPGAEWDSVAAPFAGNGFKVTKVGPGWAFLTPGSDPDIGDIEIKEGTWGFQANGTTMGRAANLMTVRSNAILNFWGCPTAGAKEIAMADESIFSGGGGASTFSGTMYLTGKVHAIVNTSSTLTYAGSINGSGKLSRDLALPPGAYPLSIGGVLELAGENSYGGGTEVTHGALRLSHNFALSTNQSVLISGTNVGGFNNANTPRLELGANVVIPPGVTANFVPSADLGSRTDFYSANGANEWQGTILVRSNGAFEIGGAAAATMLISGPIIGTNFTGSVLIRGSGTFQGTVAGQVNTAGEFAKTDSGTWTVSSVSNTWTMTSLAVGTLVLGTNDALCLTAPLVMGQGDNNTATLNLNGFNQRIPALVLNGGGTKRIANDSTISDSTLTYAGGTLTNIGTFGGILVDAYNTGTMKLGLTLESGVLALTGANTYTGPTLVKSGAALAGTGSLNSAVTVESGGVLAPGITIGTLTVNSNLTLNAGCTNLFEVTHTPLASDAVVGLTSVTYGGTLIITNVGVAPLAAGDSFQLFQAGSYAGSFAAILPAAPGAGLAWDTNALSTTGTISVVATTPPNLDAVSRLPDRNVQLTISGPVGASYSVRASTDVSLALSNWTVINSGTITVSPFTFSDLNATNFSRRFYRVSVP